MQIMEGSHFPPVFLKSNNGEEKKTDTKKIKKIKRRIRAMGDLFTWLISFFFLILLLVILGYQLMLLTDLEFDYINPYDSASRINKVVLPEFVTQGILCFIHLVVGHWFMFLLSLPYLYYNVRLYMRKQHLVDVTEIYNQLSSQKNQRLYKFGHNIIILCASIFWMIWSVGESYD